jgi:peptidoglycan/xylan/chitin deacetylase (PgdA/CDA1 family)
LSTRKKGKSRKTAKGPSYLPILLLFLVAVAAGLGFLFGRHPGFFSRPGPDVEDRVLAERAQPQESQPGVPERAEAEEKHAGTEPPAPAQPDQSHPPPGAEVSSIPLPPESPIDEIDRAPGRPAGKIALTFDAGAATGGTESILKTLKTSNIHSTFFLTGEWSERNPKLTRLIAQDGNEIANHTYSHKDLTKLSDKEIVDELARADAVISEAAGASLAPYFRPPFGARNKHVLSVAAREGYSCVYWTVDSWDAYKAGITADEISRRVLSRAQDGCIVLMHCGSTETAKALPGIIDKLSERYELVTISELLK